MFQRKSIIAIKESFSNKCIAPSLTMLEMKSRFSPLVSQLTLMKVIEIYLRCLFLISSCFETSPTYERATLSKLLYR